MTRAAIVSFVLVLAVLLAIRAARTGPDAAPRADDVGGEVVRVVDGDTIVVDIGGTDERVRYIGVDTPESVKPGSPVQCYGKAAAAFNAHLVAGRRVRLVADAERRDRYGRLLAYVYRRSDGLFVNAELMQRGYAQPLTIPPNVRFADRLTELRAGGSGCGPRPLEGLLKRYAGAAMRMRRSLAELEEAFVEDAWVDRARAEEAVRRTNLRRAARHVERRHKHGTMRFLALVIVLLATAVLVTIAMFETLYYVMG